MKSLPIATAIVQKLKSSGHIVYFAGGWVRDFILQHPSDDIDIATSASVEEIQALFPKTIPVGIAFGICIVVVEGHHFEVASFRKEKGYIDGRRPTDIEPATPEEDAQRRDFTINGMFYDPIEKKIYDYVGGQKDLQNKIIKAIGNPHERFLEDRLRMMRAVRYSTRFDFPIDTKTFNAIIDHAPSLFPSVAMERVWQEFKKMSQFAHFDKGLIILHKLKLLPTIFPELKETSTEQIEDLVKNIPKFPKGAPALSELLELFPNYSLEQLNKLCEYLKLSKDEKNFASFLLHTKTITGMPKAWQDNLEKIEWAKFYANPHSEICLRIIAASLPNKEVFLKEHEDRKNSLTSSIMRIQKNTPVLSAADLLKEGILPGKQMGLLLQEALRLSVNENLENKEEILKKLKISPLWR